MDWNNFFMGGSNQNFNFVPGAFPPGGGGGGGGGDGRGGMYQNEQQNWQYYPTFSQNYISEPSSLQPMISPLGTSLPYGGSFSHTGDFQDRNVGTAIVSAFPVLNRNETHVNESFGTPTDILTSILSASSLTPTAGEFVPRSRNVQKTEPGNVVSGYSPSQQLQQETHGAISRKTENKVVKEPVCSSNNISYNFCKSNFQTFDCMGKAQWEKKNDDKKDKLKCTNIYNKQDETIGSQTRFFHSSNYNSTQDDISVDSDIVLVQKGCSGENTIGDEPKHLRSNNSKSNAQGNETSVRKGSGRILQSRVNENMKASSSRDSKNQGRQKLLAEAATFYSSSSDGRNGADEACNTNFIRKSFDWQAHRNSNRDAFFSNNRNYNSKMDNRRECDISNEESVLQERERNASGGRTFYSQKSGIKSERNDNRANKNEKKEAIERSEKNDRGNRCDRADREDRSYRGERMNKGERSDRVYRNDQGYINDRATGSDSSDRNIQGDVNDGIDKRDRVDGSDRMNRSDRMNKSGRIDRNDRRDGRIQIDKNDRENKSDRENGRDRGERTDRGRRNNWGERNEICEINDKGYRSDKWERSGRGEMCDWNDRGNRRWDQTDKREATEKVERNDRFEKWNERGIRNDRDTRNNQGNRLGKPDGSDRDRVDVGKYQKMFYGSKFSSRNHDVSNERNLSSDNGSSSPHRTHSYVFDSNPNVYPLENDNNFHSRQDSNQGQKTKSYGTSDVSIFRSDSNISRNREDSINLSNSFKIIKGKNEEKNSATLNDSFKSNKRASQSEDLKMNVSSIQLHHSDDAASQRERLSDQLSRGALECLVCCERVRQHDAVWSCCNCYHVLHLRCVKKWARSSRAESGWRCPACQNVTSKMPQEYRCFCGKMQDPEWNRQDIPHSCGELCGRSRAPRGSELGPCVHKCTLLCHPGPCPSCLAQVNRQCGCGKTSQIVCCGSSQPLLCEGTCDKLLNCQLHCCSKICHWGSCGDCEQVVKQECFCGKVSQEVACTEVTVNVKHYSCKEVCARKLACNNHTCKLVCHDGECSQCELLPSRVTHCPCGKTRLSDDCQRTSCLDPVPTCGQPCEKILPCGQPGNYHRCQAECHAGPCPPCSLTTFVKCRCGHMDREIECKELTTKADDARCEKRCSKKRSCGKHKCNQTCCIDIDHRCPLPCNHILSCGQHRCEELCHRGHCQPCWRTSFEELYCECGASVILPPVPCGTRRPACTKPCGRQHLCEHEALHKCHSEPTCPPCTVLMEKFCYGKHERRKAVPCHQTEFSCGMPCGRPLPCGRHSCILPCHKGSCVREGYPVCTQPCKLIRSLCGHPCAAPCHDGPCPDTPCKETVRVTCECGHRSTTRPCCDQTKEYRRVMTALLASKMQDVQLGHAVDLADIGGPSARADSLKTLDCSDECKIIERNRRLAIGLQICNPDLSSKLKPRYSEFMRQWGKRDPYFVSMVHDRLTELVQLAKQSKQKSRSYSFSSMNRDKRHFIHEYCEHFGCESQAYDPEPNRNVVATAQRDRAWLPSMSLLEVLQRESGQRKVPKPVTARAVDSKIKETPSVNPTSQAKASEGSSKTEKEVEIDYFECTT